MWFVLQERRGGKNVKERKEWQGGKLVTRPTGLEPGNYDTEESRGTSKEQVSPDHKVTLGVITLFT